MHKQPPNTPSTSAATQSGRYELSAQDFQKISALIYQRAGIVLAAHKQEMVYNRLLRRVRALNLANFSQYIQFLEKNPQSSEWQEFTNALTTNLTAFFREAHHFSILAQRARQHKGCFTLWCCAASTGEEPWSLAITLAESLGLGPGRFQIYASDIDTHVLEKGKQGIYRQENLSMLTPEQLQRYFFKGTGEHSGLVRVRPELAATVTFYPLNLLSPEWKLKEKVDAIFCRNVMIYFDKKTQQTILGRMANVLQPDGLLFAGHSENLSQLSTDFLLQGQTVYRLAEKKK
ncbi:protein-glutamate O-methyltransferase CheR [Rosenbergiella epipactidis]|uniref:protein-glutamate O-methyltransferase CheR n=1 Tax=Rosenbergiella epipactidis TaxID=1544694 RepID=UPI001BDABF8C|nr:protein-glutamate O-methyltransferase CheR [Rosenbergiella epipactidis]MBT0717165.1 protein-glutamate O-methyltransferase CheR [Rosenbergiella epipactidis]